MPRELTLEQVRSVDRYAMWEGEQKGVEVTVIWFRDRRVQALWNALSDDVGETRTFTVTLPDTGWVHVPGCDCKFCDG
jgi:hypothetical protein